MTDQENDTQVDLNDLWVHMDKTTEILRTPQFVHHDVCEITGLKYDQLRRWISRELSTLQIGARGRSTGGRRLFNGHDIIALVFVKELSDAGVPIRYAALTAEMVKPRADQLMHGVYERKNMAMVLNPIDGGADWQFTKVYMDGLEDEEPDLPNVIVMVSVDELIQKVVTQIKDIIAQDPYEEEESDK